jgi:hypothetical protein
MATYVKYFFTYFQLTAVSKIVSYCPKTICSCSKFNGFLTTSLHPFRVPCSITTFSKKVHFAFADFRLLFWYDEIKFPSFFRQLIKIGGTNNLISFI